MGGMYEKTYCFYILAKGPHGTLYTGVTNDLARRVCEHKTELNEGFTKKYHVHQLVFYESYGDIIDAITREKQIKKWNRAWKIRLIRTMNPDWKDLNDGWQKEE
jgi:putative endonuclease